MSGNEDEEKANLIKNEPENDPNLPASKKSGNDYKEDRKFLCCFTFKCGVTFFGIFIALYLVFEIFNIVYIGTNPYFPAIFPLVYGLCLTPILLSFCIFVYYWISD